MVKNKEEDDFDDEELSEDDDIDDYDDDFDDYLGDDVNPPLEKHKDLLRDLTNFDPYIKEMIVSWRGLTWDYETKKYIDNDNDSAIISEKGAIWCASLLRTYARGNNVITYLDNKKYENIIEDHIDAIWLNLGTREDFGITNDGDLLRIGNELEHAAILALSGGIDGKYTKFLSTTISRNEHINLRESPNSQQPITINTSNPNGFINKMRRKFEL